MCLGREPGCGVGNEIGFKQTACAVNPLTTCILYLVGPAYEGELTRRGHRGIAIGAKVP